MCSGEMRNLAPACLNGLSTAYLSGGTSAVGAQRVQQENKYCGMNTVMNTIPSAICVPRILHIQLSNSEGGLSWTKIHDFNFLIF